MDEDELDISNPFGNLKPAPLPVYTQPKHELITDQKNELSKLLTGLTPAQETEIALFMEKMRWGINGVTPITCKDEDCHPEGTIIKTVDGDKKIEDLTNDDLVYGWARNGQYVRPKGYKITNHKRDYNGRMVILETASGSHHSTAGHYSIVRWSDEAKDSFAVYLMKKNNTWRVGKTKLFGHKGTFGPALRARAEKADCLWLLGVYKDNAAALLNEEYYSIFFQTPKSLFVATNKKEIKHDGLYKWVTQEQLDSHHERFNKPLSFFEDRLSEIMLSIDYPIWVSKKDKFESINESTTLGQDRVLIINSINIVSDLMECAVYPKEIISTTRGYKTNWEKVNKKVYHYCGLVFSLNVDTLHTYFANNIVTHNCPYYTKCALVRADIPRPKGKDCPIEVSLVQSWLNEFIGTSGVELRSLSAYDMLILQDIAYQQLLEARAAMELADNPLIQVKTFIGTDPNDGNPMYTYTLNNLITFREKSNKMKMKLLQEMIATAKAKSQEERGKQDRSSETAERLKRIEEKLGADKITSKAIDAVFKSKEIK